MSAVNPWDLSQQLVSLHLSLSLAVRFGGSDFEMQAGLHQTQCGDLVKGLMIHGYSALANNLLCPFPLLKESCSFVPFGQL